MLRIRIENNDWGGAQLADVAAVVSNTADHLIRHLRAPRPTGDVIVQCRPNESNPRILYRTAPSAPHYIWLTTQGRLWCKIAYQFAHELCHLISDHNRLRHSTNKWFHEALCELASIFAISQMAESWPSNAPYPNWASYSTSLREYADEVLNRDVHQLPAATHLSSWFRENESVLASDPCQRDLNGVVAVAMYPIFKDRPDYWELVRWMPSTDGEFLAFLDLWDSQVPSHLAGGVEVIADLFGHRVH